MKDFSLVGECVELVPLTMDHVDELFKAGNHSEIWRYLSKKVTSREDMSELVSEVLHAKDKGLEYPFTVLDAKSGRVLGSTRYLNISKVHRNLEIGWTWYSPDVWGTIVNIESKYLLLRYGFEILHLIRVQFKADVRNERSNRAIRKIGGIHEGVLRQDRILHDGYIRNANIYSIIAQEWADVKQKFEEELIPSKGSKVKFEVRQ
jgi:RimJ/RimL family protein N-acetyltransferase